MRTQKRFTADLLRRFEREGRGTGTHQNYVPWHRVGRGDPASIGRSHLTNWRNRLIETLSDKEWRGIHFALMLNNLADVREQLPLAFEGAPHEGSDYNVSYLGKTYPGTSDIAKQLGIKHPLVQGGEERSAWTMTTDQLLALNHGCKVELLALSYKPDVIALTKRKRELLALEREYWLCRGVRWLLITPAQYELTVALTLLRAAPWALAQPVPELSLSTAVNIAVRNSFRSFTTVINMIGDALGEQSAAEFCFWQAVFRGDLPLDLRRGWRPHLPITLVSSPEFRAFNPIISGRSAWN
jgi:TnsA endonuclease N terminal